MVNEESATSDMDRDWTSRLNIDDTLCLLACDEFPRVSRAFDVTMSPLCVPGTYESVRGSVELLSVFVSTTRSPQHD